MRSARGPISRSLRPLRRRSATPSFMAEGCPTLRQVDAQPPFERAKQRPMTHETARATFLSSWTWLRRPRLTFGLLIGLFTYALLFFATDVDTRLRLDRKSTRLNSSH